MINLKARQWVLVLVCCFFCFFNNTAFATDTAVPDNPTTTSPDTLDLNNGTITNPQYGCPSGTTAAQVNTSNWGTETVRFGECVNTFAITYAINQALQGSGVSIDKVHYSWRYVMCFNTPDDSCNTNISNRVNTTTGEVTDDTYFDELQVVIEITDSSGNVVETKTWNMEKWYQWNAANSYSDNEIQDGSVYWQIHEDNIEVYNHTDKIGTIRTPNSVGDVRFRINGYDKGNWDGYYGPVINRLQTWFTYRANPCNDTALYDPSCPGYSEAYATWQYDQNCAADALYDPGCPGYAQANYNAQCDADPLYDSGCDGYATAYYNQQCDADPLYDSGCSGYDSAYLSQQCEADSQYSYECPNYQFPKETDPAMNVSGQGSDYIFIYRPNNPEQFDTLMADIDNITNWVWGCEKSNGDECPGTLYGGIKDYSYDGGDYLFLYTIDEDDNIVYPDSGRWYSFIEYDHWYGSCEADINFDDSCSEYTRIQEENAQAEYDANCSANPLYDSGCPGYASAYETQQCNANPLYSTSCSGYQQAYYNQQCEANPLYDSGCPGYEGAYFTKQCDEDPLYSTNCTGYQTAYYNQQCEADPLYDTECPGFEQAYLTQQCSINSLYDSSCSGYEEAYLNQQCSLNPLYDETCPGYEVSYFNQKCSLDPQHDTQCPGYVAPVVETADPVAIDNGISTGDSVVDSILATPDLPIVIVPIVPPPPVVVTPIAPVESVEPEATIPNTVEQIEAEIETQIEAEIIEEPVVEETIEEQPIQEDNTNEENEQTETSDENGEVTEEDVESVGGEEEQEEAEADKEESASGDKEVEEKEVKEETTTAKKETKKKPLTKKQKADAKKKKMKEIIKEKLKALAIDIGKAQSLEDQAALQQVIAALINYVPGFNQYGKYNIPGRDFYQPESIYKDKKIPENQRGLLNGLASELKHKKMVDMQYEGME